MADKYTWDDVKYSDSGLMNAAKMLGLANLNFSTSLDSVKNAMDSNLLTQAANIKAKKEFDTNQAIASLLPNLSDPLKFQNTLNSDAFKTMTENGSVDAKTLTDALAKGALITDSNQKMMSVFEKDKADQSNNALLGNLLSGADLSNPNNAAKVIRDYASNFNSAGAPVLNTLSSLLDGATKSTNNAYQIKSLESSLATAAAQNAHTAAQTNTLNTMLPYHVEALKAQTDDTKVNTDAKKTSTNALIYTTGRDTANTAKQAADEKRTFDIKTQIALLQSQASASGINFNDYFKLDDKNNSVSLKGVQDNFDGAFEYIKKVYGNPGQRTKDPTEEGDMETQIRNKLAALQKDANITLGITKEGKLTVNPTEKVVSSVKVGELPAYVLLSIAKSGLQGKYNYLGFGNTLEGYKDNNAYYNPNKDSFKWDVIANDSVLNKALSAEVSNVAKAKALYDSHMQQTKTVNVGYRNTMNNLNAARFSMQTPQIEAGANAANTIIKSLTQTLPKPKNKSK